MKVLLHFLLVSSMQVAVLSAQTDYIQPGDMVRVRIGLGSEQRQYYTVDKQGSVDIDQLGKFLLGGKTRDQAANLIGTQLASSQDGGRSKINVRVDILEPTVEVKGKVYKPITLK